MEKRPMTTKKKLLADYIAARIALTGKTQREIAHETGVSSVNFISMLKCGKAEVPLARVPALAAAIGASYVDLMFLCLNAQEPALAAIFAALQPELPTTDDEVALMRAYRELRKEGVIDEKGFEIRGLGADRRTSKWARVSRK
jgi:transcriptional regulator with XRE-family HTH domain